MSVPKEFSTSNGGPYGLRTKTYGRRAVFLDRDGVLVNPVIRDGRPCAPLSTQEFNIVKDAPRVCKKLYMTGFDLFVVSNQPDVARGYLSKRELAWMDNILYENFDLKDILNCIHDDKDDCICRKPKPGMINVLVELYGIDKSQSYMIGDTWKDAEAANSAGVKMVMLRKSYNFLSRLADHLNDPELRYKAVWSLEGATKWILRQ